MKPGTIKSGTCSLRNYFELSGLLVLALLAAACSVGGANFHIFPDKSGIAEFNEMVFDFGDRNVKRPDFQGIRRKQLMHMSIKTTGYEFEDTSKVVLGGIKLNVVDKGDDLLITADIPLARTSGWYQVLNIDENKRRGMQRFIKHFQKAMGGTRGPLSGGLAGGVSDIMTVNIAVFGPGKIKSKKVVAPAGKSKWFKDAKPKAAAGGPPTGGPPTGGPPAGGVPGGPGANAAKPNEARLQIPMSVVLEGRYPRVRIEVLSEKKLVPSAKEKWRKFKSKEDSILGPMGKGGLGI